MPIDPVSNANGITNIGINANQIANIGVSGHINQISSH
jgi:hypothetical protein